MLSFILSYYYIRIIRYSQKHHCCTFCLSRPPEFHHLCWTWTCLHSVTQRGSFNWNNSKHNYYRVRDTLLSVTVLLRTSIDILQIC